MSAGGTNAHGDARNRHHHVHQDEHETNEWLMDPFPTMTAVELNQMLMERANECASQDSMRDRHPSSCSRQSFDLKFFKCYIWMRDAVGDYGTHWSA